jgi:hypothetical protein
LDRHLVNGQLVKATGIDRGRLLSRSEAEWMARHRAVTLDVMMKILAMVTVSIVIIIPILSLLYFRSIQPVVVLLTVFAGILSVSIVIPIEALVLPLWWVGRAHRLLGYVPGLYERGIQLSDFPTDLFIPYEEIVGIRMRSRPGVRFLIIEVRNHGRPFGEYADLLDNDDISLLQSMVRQMGDGSGRPALRLYGTPSLQMEGDGKAEGDALHGTGAGGPSMVLKY